LYRYLELEQIIRTAVFSKQLSPSGKSCLNTSIRISLLLFFLSLKGKKRIDWSMLFEIIVKAHKAGEGKKKTLKNLSSIF